MKNLIGHIFLISPVIMVLFFLYEAMYPYLHDCTDYSIECNNNESIDLGIYCKDSVLYPSYEELEADSVEACKNSSSHFRSNLINGTGDACCDPPTMEGEIPAYDK